MRELLPILDDWAAAGHRAALCTIVAVHDHAPLPLGTCMIVAEDGRSAGALSGGCVEREVTEVAQAVLRGAPSRRLRFAPSDDPLSSTALPCGGGIDVWIQSWQPGTRAPAQEAYAAAVRAGQAAALAIEVGPAETLAGLEPTEGVASSGGAFTLQTAPVGRLVLVGAGPLAGALCDLAPSLGMRPIVVDPREHVAAAAPIASASELLLCWPAEALDRLAPLGADDALIALSHQPAIDDAALRAAVASEVGFVGALGARRTQAARLERLREVGASEVELARIVGPVGLDLGGWAPGEVALSIAAELVAARHGRTGGSLSAGDGPIHSTVRTSQPTADAPHGPISAVILAAGAGRRFGGAKQAAEWNGQTLVERAVRAAAGGLPDGSEVLVVVGAHEATVRGALPTDVPHRVVVAEDWANGLGASLRAGLREATGHAVLVLLADQPLVDAALVARVVREGCPAIERGAAAARPVVDGHPGHPVLLGPIALTRANDADGDTGLGPLLSALYVHEISIRGRAAVVDVDQPADLLRGAPPTRPASRSSRTPSLPGSPMLDGEQAAPATQMPPWT